MAGAPNSTYSREFPPQDGPIFLNMINFNTLDADLRITFPNLVWKAAAEIRSGPTGDGAQDLAFEFYRAGRQVGQTTVANRGLDNFFFYGFLSDAGGFDTMVIRQSPDYRFSLDNLQFEAVPEPHLAALTGLVIAGLAAFGLSPRARSRR